MTRCEEDPGADCSLDGGGEAMSLTAVEDGNDAKRATGRDPSARVRENCPHRDQCTAGVDCACEWEEREERLRAVGLGAGYDIRIEANDPEDAAKAALLGRYVNGELAVARAAREARRRLLRLRIEPSNPVFGALWLVNLATIGWLAGVVDCEWFPAEVTA